ncbi:MAG: PKD domain-containing protein [Saprospiraceae bacterium]|nr:PKD domain-containing protein [Saprospiraceae bacterium]
MATGPCDEATSSQEISVNVAPTAAFDFSNTGSCAPQIVFFENQSSSNTNEFEWHFPGGNPSTSTDESPVVEYAFAGLYDVVLIAQNSQGADTVTVQQAIEVGGLPSVDFGVNVSNLVVDFSNLSLNASMGYLWDFGDGSTSAEPNPVHVYASQAIYEVTLTAYNACGEQSVTLPVPTGNLPLAGFTANTNLGCSPLVVQFQNQSSGANLTGFQWEFPGGTPSTSTEENPTVTYTTPGSFAVALTATNSLGSHVLEQTNIVQVQASPEAIFSYAVDGLTVTFNNQSENATFFNWDFDDGNESQVLNPVHTYDAPGVYNVSLTTANSSCGSAIAQTVYLAPSATAEEADQQHLLIFPNPASSEFTVYFKNEKYSNGQIRLMGATGEVLQVVDIQGDVLKFDASRYAPGVYFIEVKGLGGNVSVHKLVKI